MIELVFSPQSKIALLINLEAKEKGGFGGKKTAAHLAAMRVIRLLMARCFRVEAFRMALPDVPPAGKFLVVSQLQPTGCELLTGDGFSPVSNPNRPA